MYNSIIISSCLFGSIYIFSKSLELINISLLKKNKMPYKLIFINGLTFIISGSMFIYGFKLLPLSYFNFKK